MDEDHVDSDQLPPLSDRLGSHFANVRDELQLQILRLGATVAGAKVGRDILPLEVECAVHPDRGPGGRGDRRIAVQRVSPTREEGRVAFDLDQVEVGCRVITFSSSLAVFTSAWARLIR